MRRICLLCLLMAGHFALQASSRDTVTWSSRRLDFKDFRMQSASEDFESSLKLNSHTILEGYIYNGIHFRYRQQGRRLICEVKAYMVPAESFIRNREDEATLEHEQAHFDITEIYARRLRRDLSKVRNEVAAKKLMQANFDALQQEQKRFDRSHKNECGVHPLWQEKIDQELKELEPWADPQVTAEIN